MKELDLSSMEDKTADTVGTTEDDEENDEAFDQYGVYLSCKAEEEGAKGKEEDRNKKATKGDDAEVPIKLWDDRVRAGLPYVLEDSKYTKGATGLRTLLLKIWRRQVARSFWKWILTEEVPADERGKNIETGLIAISYAVKASWWDWDSGSAPFFWRFPKEWQKDMRDGVAPQWLGEPLRCTQKQRKQKDPIKWKLERSKILKVRQRGYIAALLGILSLTSFFSVLKGKDDIRMVYNGTSCGLNKVLFAPWFALPTVIILIRSVDGSTWQADNDFG